jgi:hypothetical protein
MVEQLASKIVLEIKNRQVGPNDNIHAVKSKEIQNIITKKYFNNFTTTTTNFDINNIIENHQIDKKIEEGDEDNIHIIFSTDCSFFQDWQTLLVFHSAIQVKQHGKITRIASGCNEQKQKDLIQLYAKLFPFYSIHFTPDFKKDSKTGKKYDFYNKPYGIQHWLQYASPVVDSGTIIIILDPDMIFLRPITSKIYLNPANIYSKRFDPNIDKIPLKVKASNPVAQLYGLGAPWTFDRHRHFNRSFICGEDSPCLKTTRIFGEEHYRYGVLCTVYYIVNKPIRNIVFLLLYVLIMSIDYIRYVYHHHHYHHNCFYHHLNHHQYLCDLIHYHNHINE